MIPLDKRNIWPSTIYLSRHLSLVILQLWKITRRQYVQATPITYPTTTKQSPSKNAGKSKERKKVKQLLSTSIAMERVTRTNLSDASSLALNSAISASAAESLCWQATSASLAALTLSSRLCSSKAFLRTSACDRALRSDSLISATSLNPQKRYYES